MNVLERYQGVKYSWGGIPIELSLPHKIPDTSEKGLKGWMKKGDRIKQKHKKTCNIQTQTTEGKQGGVGGGRQRGDNWGQKETLLWAMGSHAVIG